ncbi:MAG: hypothetical protein IIT33_10955, partial [Prevotella sp.]|nr:hypothetical protein [Prevotella sp.]
EVSKYGLVRLDLPPVPCAGCKRSLLLYLPVQEACLLISPGPRRGKVNIAPADEGGSDEVSRLL